MARTGLVLRGRGPRWVPAPGGRASYLSEDEAGGSSAAIGSFQSAPPGRGASGHLNSTHRGQKESSEDRSAEPGGLAGLESSWETSPRGPRNPRPSLPGASQRSHSHPSPRAGRSPPPRAPTTSINKASRVRGPSPRHRRQEAADSGARALSPVAGLGGGEEGGRSGQEARRREPRLGTSAPHSRHQGGARGGAGGGGGGTCEPGECGPSAAPFLA